MRSCLMVLLLIVGVADARTSTLSLEAELEKMWAEKLLLVTDEGELQSLSGEISNLRDRFWLCQKEWDGQVLPLACYQLVHDIKSSTHFHSISMHTFISSLELQCGVALHHQGRQSLSDLKMYSRVPWPSESSCYTPIKKALQRMEYMQSTRY